MQAYLSEIISFLVGFGGGSLLTLRLTRKTKNVGGNTVDQSGASAGGDIVGRDKR